MFAFRLEFIIIAWCGACGKGVEAVVTSPSNAPEIVGLRDVVKVYRKPNTDVEVVALRGVNVSFRRGDHIAIIGASGSGKSTMMNIIGCLDRPTAGAYFLNGRDVSNLDDDELSDERGRRIGFVFQNFNLIMTQSVVENLEVPLYYLGVPARQRRERALQLARRVGLEDRLSHRPNELSGGQQQRVAIARALVNDPVLLLADEPTGNLDSATGQSILALLDELNATGMTIILVTHDASVAARCRRVVEMRDGRIVNGCS